jgi:hypothetical protein
VSRASKCRGAIDNDTIWMCFGLAFVITLIGMCVFALHQDNRRAEYIQACDRAGGQVTRINSQWRCVKRPVELEIEVTP